MRKNVLFTSLVLAAMSSFASFIVSANVLFAATPTPSPVVQEETPTPEVVADITQKSDPATDTFEVLLNEQKLGNVWPGNPVKYAIRAAVGAGVPTNTIVLLLLLPVVAAVIASARHIIGIRGFGIFLPAALSVVFVATGPVEGIVLFLAIVFASTIYRVVLRKSGVKLQYLPRMALMLWIVAIAVLGILFLAPYINQPKLTGVSIFPVLILTLLAEDFSKVQLGKSIRVAISLTSESLILALVCYVLLTFRPLQEFALLFPEMILLSVAVFDYVLARYVGLRFLEYWKFRKLIGN